jgi:hypothetical protein
MKGNCPSWNESLTISQHTRGQCKNITIISQTLFPNVLFAVVPSLPAAVAFGTGIALL